MSTKSKATPATKEPKVTTTKTAGKRGRPVVGTSARQAKLAARAARVAAGGSIERGRPSNPESKRQARLQAQAARAAAGIAVKVGRPKGSSTKAEAAATAA